MLHTGERYGTPCEGFHAHRATGRHRDYRDTRRDTVPCVRTGRESARSASCLSNLRQFALATLQYVQDYDEVFPQSVYSMDSLLLLPGSPANA